MTGFQRLLKYEVLKLEDIDLLGPGEKQDLHNLIDLIQDSREARGKPRCNRYVVVNEDEPYAKIVWKLIELGETKPESMRLLVQSLETAVSLLQMKR